MPKLAYSPPNDAIIKGLLSLGAEVDVYAPDDGFDVSDYGAGVTAHSAQYGYKWLLGNAWQAKWRQYDIFSGTSEDPMVIVGALSAIHRKPSVTLADEIRTGSYSGSRSVRWKKLCQWAMRRSDLKIVNDKARISLLQDYIQSKDVSDYIVYPGCFNLPPEAADRKAMRKKWNVPDGHLVIADSGVFEYEHSALWLIEAVVNRSDLNLVLQPLRTSSLSLFLLTRIQGAERIYIEPERIEWRDAWAQMGAVDIGVAVYRQTGPQFQNMGISSNRLCMFLAMGIPVIASKQSSFEFLEDYDCGVLVENEAEFMAAIDYIKPRLDEMKQNAIQCTREYIDAPGKYNVLVERLADVISV